jgi:hypothetical protein
MFELCVRCLSNGVSSMSRYLGTDDEGMYLEYRCFEALSPELNVILGLRLRQRYLRR